METYLDVWLAKGTLVRLYLPAGLLVIQLVAEEFNPLLVLHWYNVVCECAFSVYKGMMAKATERIKIIPNIFEIPIVFLNFQLNIPDFELVIKNLVDKNI